jgi:hypothetical protein
VRPPLCARCSRTTFPGERPSRTRCRPLRMRYTASRCRNSAGATRVYLGNSGNVASGTYNLRIRLSTTTSIRYFDATAAPQIEVAIVESDDMGRSWSFLAMATPAFVDAFAFVAEVVDGPPRPGEISIQLVLSAGNASFAPSGRLTLRLLAGRLEGETSGMGDQFMAGFAGPFVVSCAVPATMMASGTPAPKPDDASTPLVVDEDFASPLCQPSAPWPDTVTESSGSGRCLHAAAIA